MRIKNISIIGLGLIGGSIAKALKETEFDFTLSGYDKDEVSTRALSEKVIDKKLSTIEKSADSELIFLCLPVDISLKVFDKLIPNISEKTIITDVCGVKNIFRKKWQESLSKGIYIGGHPMTGKEKGGYDNSDSLLFENAVYILSDTPKDFPGKEDFVNIIKGLGARITYLPPELHDKIVANVSHLPQLLSVGLLNSRQFKDENINFLDFAAGGFRDMTRIASSDFNIWKSILQQNKDEINFSINNLIVELGKLKKLLNEEKMELIAEEFESAREKRDEIPKNTKGFITTLYDLFVFVKDEPGVISKISTKLFENSINIKDIELLKIREGTGGTFRLSFATEKDAERAKILIESLGYTTK